MKIRLDRTIATLAAFVAVAAPITAAHAEPSTPAGTADSATPGVDPGVKAAITQWAATVGKQKAFAWKSTLKVTRITGDPKTVKPEDREYKVTGFAEKPDRVHLEVSEGDKLVWVFTTAGDKGYSYEPVTKKYTDLGHFQAHDMASPALVTSSMFITGDPVAFLDTGMGVPLKLSVKNDTSSSTIVGAGQTVSATTADVNSPVMSIKANVGMTFDATSHMLTARSSSIDMGSLPKLDAPIEQSKPLSSVICTETFEKIDFPKSLPADTFTWQPPADATVDTTAPAVGQ